VSFADDAIRLIAETAGPRRTLTRSELRRRNTRALLRRRRLCFPAAMQRRWGLPDAAATATLLVACLVPPLVTYGALALAMPPSQILTKGRLCDPVYFGWHTMRFFPLDPSVATYRAALSHLLARTAPGDEVLAIPAEANRPQLEYGRKEIGVDHGHPVARFVAEHYEREARFGEAFRIVAWRRRAADEAARPPDAGAAPRAAAVAPDAATVPALPAGISVERDVVYAEVDGVSLALDVYRPEGRTEKLPVLLFLHGGGWMLGDKRDALPHEGRPAQAFQRGRRWPTMLPWLRHGVAVVAPRYRLSGEAPAPAALEDVQRALAWIGRDGAAHQLDPSRIVAIGPSAGGHLALLLGLAPLPEDAPRPVGVIDLYGPTDVADLLPPSRNARPFARRWIPEGEEQDALLRRVSPLAHVHAGAPPVLIVHGDADDVVPYAHSVRLADALRAAGVRVELVTLPGGRHGFLTEAELGVLERSVAAFLESIAFFRPAERRD